MKYLWSATSEDYMEIVKMAQANGKKPGDSMQEEFLQYMKEKNRKPIGATELNREELLSEYASKGKNILDIRTNKEGKTSLGIIKKDKNSK